MKKLTSLALCFVLMLMLVMTSTSFAAGRILENPAAAKTQPVVEVEGGKLIGFMRDGTYCFWGVDYAYADRFEMPKKVEPWDGYQFAQSYGMTSLIPVQTAVGADEFVWPHRYWTQSDHCQNLNIWTQSLDTAASKPVVVFFHGGGHTNGSSIESTAYDGQNLSEYGDVVVVTVNHRLNVIGYLDLSSFGEEYTGSGNYGAADLVASLEWIRDNIAQFGGDPENVTIFGQSGGGTKVSTLLRMPSAQGLVDKAGMISGGSPNIDDNTYMKMAGERTVELLGLTAETLDEIKTIDYFALLNAANDAYAQIATEQGLSRLRFGPSADNVIVMDEMYYIAGMPILVTGMFSESAVSSYKYGDGRHNEWDESETMEKLTERFDDKAEALLAEFNKLYPEMTDANLYFYNNTMNSKWATAETLTALGANVYLYEFDYEAPVNGGITAFHCEDLIFLFHNVTDPMVNIAYGEDPAAYDLQDTVANAFLSLMKTGSPSTGELPWSEFESGSHLMMKFNVESKCVDHDTTAYTEILNAK